MGLPLLVGTTVIALLLADRLLPDRTSSQLPADFGGYAATVAEHYELDRTVVRVRVQAASRIVGTQVGDLILDDYPALRLVGVQDTAGTAVDERLGTADTPEKVAGLLDLCANPGIAYTVSKRGVMLLAKREAHRFGE